MRKINDKQVERLKQKIAEAEAVLQEQFGDIWEDGLGWEVGDDYVRSSFNAAPVTVAPDLWIDRQVQISGSKEGIIAALYLHPGDRELWFTAVYDAKAVKWSQWKEGWL